MNKINRSLYFHKIDSDGNIINNAKRSKIIEPWRGAVDDIINTYSANFKDKILSIYLRGSVACKRAIEYISDIDFMVIVRQEFNDDNLSIAQSMGDDLKSKYQFVTAVSFDIINYKEMFLDQLPCHFNAAFTIQTQGVLLYGQDLAKRLRKFQPDILTACYIASDLQSIYNNLINILQNTRPPAIDLFELCRWIMKLILRNLFLSLMPTEKRYTRDLYSSYHIASRHYPHYSAELYRILELAIAPTQDRNTILLILQTTGSWVAQEIERRYKTIDFTIDNRKYLQDSLY
jgi:hypothetical protein